jgi:hypothetical protein
MAFRFILYDEPGVDKRVDLGIEVVRGDSTLGSAFLKNVKLGEKKSVQKMIDFQAGRGRPCNRCDTDRPVDNSRPRRPVIVADWLVRLTCSL